MSCVRKRVRIGKMTCVNCQNKIRKKLCRTAGVKEVSVSYDTGMAEILFDTELILFKDIVGIIENLGYEVLPEGKEKQFEVTRSIRFLVIIIALYTVLWKFGLLNLLVPGQLADSGMGYGMLFVVGLITSVHCIAMCGGINLSQCIPKTENQNEGGRFSVYLPSFLYNFGRVVSYTAVGFILGFAGMLIGGDGKAGFPTLAQGILKLIAGIFMIIMGMNMLGIFPGLRKIRLRVPGFFAEKIGKQKAAASQPLIVGILNGLMPCGPLQSMQIAAFASGNPVSGALSMFMFSLGTVPLMLGFGSVISALGKRFAKAVMSIGAVLVVVLGLAMLSQGGSLSGLLMPDRLLFVVIAFSVCGVLISIPFSSKIWQTAAVTAALSAVIVADRAWAHWNLEQNADVYLQDNLQNEEIPVQSADGVQVVKSTLAPGRYPSITVHENTPVRWVIDAPEGSINGCNYKMLIQDYGIEYSFREGENVIEFTPEETGTVLYTCWMGMIYGTIQVVEDDNDNVGASVNEEGDNADNINRTDTEAEDAVSDPASGLWLESGGSCCG